MFTAMPMNLMNEWGDLNGWSDAVISSGPSGRCSCGLSSALGCKPCPGRIPPVLPCPQFSWSRGFSRRRPPPSTSLVPEPFRYRTEARRLHRPVRRATFGGSSWGRIRWRPKFCWWTWIGRYANRRFTMLTVCRLMYQPVSTVGFCAHTLDVVQYVRT